MKHRCEVCGSPVRLLFKLSGYPISACKSCGHQQCGQLVEEEHDARVYGNHYFTDGGTGYPDYLDQEDLISRHGSRYARLIEQHLEPGTLLGFATQAFTEAGWHTTGIEPNPQMVKHARDRLGLTVHAGSLERLESIESFAQPREGFDLILMIQVIGHLFDLNAALRRVADMTRPGGYCLIETWDCSSLIARLLGRMWHEYSPPSVLHYFSRNSLDLLMARHGFSPVCSARPEKRTRLDHARSLLHHKHGDTMLGRTLCAIIDRLPSRADFPYLSKDLFWTLFRRRGEDPLQADASRLQHDQVNLQHRGRAPAVHEGCDA